MRVVAFDTETTGLDPWHGCRPFMVTAMDDEGQRSLWRNGEDPWRVDPFSREVSIPNSDKLDIYNYLNDADLIIAHNLKFDTRMLDKAGIPLPKNWWEKTHDTILMSHCLESRGPHGLKELALRHLDILDDDEEELRKACISARRIGTKLGYRNADKCDPHWPTMKTGQEWWKADCWMPGEIWQRRSDPNRKGYENLQEHFDFDHNWSEVCETYALRDAERTLGLWYFFQERLEAEGLWDKYLIRRGMLRSTYRMENRGITLRRFLTSAVQQKHQKLSDEHERQCYRSVQGRIDNLDSPKQLQSAMFNILKFPVVKTTPTGQPSTDKDVIAELKLTARPMSNQAWFLNHLGGFRKRSHAAGTVASYEIGCFPYEDPRQSKFTRLHPNYNITGTDTTRGSSNNPNGQNIAKGEGLPKEEKFNLRDLFGPALGRVWYSHDYSNIELRIFSHLAGEEEFLRAFAEGRSVHLLIAKLLYPEIYCDDFDTKYPHLYQWCKNGTFSIIYGASQKRADQTYHLDGAYKLVRKEFKQVDRLMSETIRIAKHEGYVVTLGGYRLQTPPEAPYAALNYLIQGSAGIAINLAMNRIDQYLDSFTDYHMIMNVHDELLHDVPEQHDPMFPHRIKALMEQSGQDLGLALPVKMNKIRISWDMEEPVPALKRKGPRILSA